MIFDNDSSIPFEEELTIRDDITRVILNGSYTSDVSHKLRSGYQDELTCRLTDSVINMLIRDHFYESLKDAVRDNIEQQTINFERLECMYTTQVELEYRIKPVLKNDDLDRKKGHQYRADSRKEVDRAIKERDAGRQSKGVLR